MKSEVKRRSIVLGRFWTSVKHWSLACEVDISLLTLDLKRLVDNTAYQ